MRHFTLSERITLSNLLRHGKTYRDIAEIIGNKKAVRAVANANGANALGLIIPSHRIIGSDGSLTGYAGGIEAKEFLLRVEKGEK